MAAMTPSGEQLVILLNETFVPPTVFTDINLVFGTPTDAPDGATDYDTVVIATGQPGRGYYGTAEIHYTRVPLSNLEGLLTLYSETGFTLQSICDGLNNEFATFLDPTDFQSVTIPNIPVGGSGQITLVAADSSLGWKGQFDLPLTYGKPQLKGAIASNKLAVLSDGLSTWLDGRLFLWNFDFTSLRDAIKPKYYPINQYIGYSGFTDFATLSSVCLKLGIPGFPNPGWVNTGVSDYSTAQIADSNKNFDRVVIYSPVWGGRFYRSSLYFHYNVLENR
jgi:hypothetical protein